MERYSFLRRLGRERVKIFGMLLLALLFLVACGKSSTDNAGTSAPQLSAGASTQDGNPSNASMALEPASGYGGLYVKVSGTKWPQNMMVLVTIEDAQGHSDTLAANDTDPSGNLTTGFLFPIDQRWLTSKSLSVVATTADGQVATKAAFTLVPPGTDVSTSQSVSALSPSKAVAHGGEAGTTVPGTVTSTLALNDDLANRVVLPLISSAGGEKRGAGKSSDSAIIQVNVDIKPEGASSIDCRRGDRWVSITIHSSNGFDATSVDPGSVTVSDGSPDLGYGGEVATTFVAFHARGLQSPIASSSAAYQWRWHVDDVDGDGVTDMVLEYRLDYLKLNCNSALLAVSGRTRDGKHFEGSDQAEKLVVKKS